MPSGTPTPDHGLKLQTVNQVGTPILDAIDQDRERLLQIAQGQALLDAIAQGVPQIFQRVKATLSPCHDCEENPQYACKTCDESDRYCWEHISQHTMTFHTEDSQYEAVRNVIVRRFMLDHGLSAFITPKRTITLSGPVPNSMKSVWFDEAQHLGLENPAIVTWNPPRSRGQQRELDETVFSQNLDRFMEIMDLRAYNWAGTEHLTFFVAARTDLPYLPEDITATDQVSVSGLVIDPEANPLKIGKRNKAHTVAEGACHVAAPSHFPELHIPGETLKLQVHDSGTTGDGSGALRKSSGLRLLRASGARNWGDIIGIQTVFLAADYSFKGLFPLVPDEKFPLPDVDLIVDSESINHQVHSVNFTKGKVIPIRHKPNKRFFFVEPLMLGEVVARFTDPHELAEQAVIIADKADRQAWQNALSEETYLEENHGPNFQPAKGSHMQRAIATKDPENRLMLAYEESGHSPFANPKVTDLMAGALSKNWAATHSKAKPMPDVVVSGEKVLLMDPNYTQAGYPKDGYVKPIWHPTDPEQIIGLGLSQQDMLRYRGALDTADCDDHVPFICLQGADQLPYALVLRTPLSIDGGVCLRWTLKDAAKLRKLGYHFYHKAGGHKYPGLHRPSKDGTLKYPYVLSPKKTENPRLWTTKEEMATTRLLEFNRGRGTVGLVCNLMANLDYSGLYDPELHALCMSDYIDDTQQLAEDPEETMQGVIDLIIEAIRGGHKMDPCVFDRIKGPLENRYKAKFNGAELPKPEMECRQPHHEVWKTVMNQLVKLLPGIQLRRKLLANGPVNALQQRFPKKLNDIVSQAFDDRYKIWSNKNALTLAINQDDTLTPNQKEARRALNLQQTKDAEATTMLNAYQTAFAQVEDYEPGQFIACWQQLTLNNARRFVRLPKPVPANATIPLPVHEHIAYYRSGPSIASAVLRTKDQIEITPGEQWTIQTPDEDSERPYSLINAQGEVLTEVSKEASLYTGLELEPIGYMPLVETSEAREIWEQAQNLLILQVKNPQDIVGIDTVTGS